MTTKVLYSDITDTTEAISVSVSDAHSQSAAVASIQAVDTNLTIGQEVTIDLGYTTNHDVVFTGYVKTITREVPNDTVTVVAHGELARAVDYFIASSNPETPFTRQDILAEDFVGDLLELAGITNYVGESSSFRYAVSVPAEVNLIGAYDYIKSLADIIAWSVYSDQNGVVRFRDRKPYLMDSDTPDDTITTSDILGIAYTESDMDLRNRVVVYGGASGVYAEASATSPYLPSGYFKSVVVATEVLDRQEYAQLAADYNLEKLNRLTKALNVTLEGNSDLHVRDVWTVQFTGTNLTVNSDWYVYSLEHAWGQNGYTINAELRQ